MLNRSNILLAIVLGVQIVLVAVSVVARTGTENRAVQPLLPGRDTVDVLELVIADDLGNSLRIARGDDGWVLPGAGNYPVKSDEVDDLLASILGLDTSRLVATNPANFARLEVADSGFQRKLSIGSAGETKVLVLGGSAGADTVYARIEGENQVYLGAGLSAWQASPQVSGWIDTSYVSVPQEDVTRISVANANGLFEFERDGQTWRYLGLPDGESFEDTKMPGVLRNAASIRMVEPLGLALQDEYGMMDPTVTVEVEYRQIVEVEAESADDDVSDSEKNETDGSEEMPDYTTESYMLSFGKKQDDSNVVLKSSASEYYVTVGEYALDGFSDLDHADLLRIVVEEAENTTAAAGE